MPSRRFPHVCPIIRTVALLLALVVCAPFDAFPEAAPPQTTAAAPQQTGTKGPDQTGTAPGQQPRSAAPSTQKKSTDKAARPAPPKPGAGIFPLDTLWSVSLPDGPALPPAYDDERAYICLRPPTTSEDGEQARTGSIVAVSLADGSTRWTREFAGATAIATGGNLVFASTGTSLQAFDNNTGDPRWQLALDSPLAVPLQYDGGWLVAATQGSQAFGVRAGDGTKLWQIHLPSPATAPPAIAGDSAYFGLTDSRIIRVHIETGATIWDRKILSQPRSLLATGDRIFAGTDRRWFYALEPEQGKVLWRFPIGASVVGQPAADRSAVYFLALDDIFRALDRGGSLKWRQLLARRARFGPFPVADVLFVSGLSTTIQAFAAETGPSVGTFDAPEDLLVPVHVAPGLVEHDFVVIALTGEGRLLALRPQSLVPEPFAISPQLMLLAGLPRWRF